jgi:iron(III) transport system substrate-binding protein
MQKLARREGLITVWDMPDVRLSKEQKNFPVAYTVPSSGTPVIIDGIALIRGGPNVEEAKRFYEFVTTPESLKYAGEKYYRIPVRTDMDHAKLPAWMNEPFKELPLDWDLLRKNGSDWLRYWDTEIRDRN